MEAGPGSLCDSVGGVSSTGRGWTWSILCRPLRSREPRAELGWIQSDLKAAAQVRPRRGWGKPLLMDGSFQKLRCCRVSPLSWESHDAQIDPWALWSMRGTALGVPELGATNAEAALAQLADERCPSAL